MIVTHADIRGLRYCNKGARAFFEKHGLSWSDFLRCGVASSVLAALNDAMADAAIRAARQRKGG